MYSPSLTMAWNDQMSVGIPEIDEDHRNFMVLINALNHAITERLAPAEIQRRLQHIIDDAKRHFVHEEQLFFEWSYPDVGEHAAIHARLLIELQEMEKNFIPYGADSGWMNAGLKVKDSLVNHILNEDMKYADYYRNSRKAVAGG